MTLTEDEEAFVVLAFRRLAAEERRTVAQATEVLSRLSTADQDTIGRFVAMCRRRPEQRSHG